MEVIKAKWGNKDGHLSNGTAISTRSRKHIAESGLSSSPSLLLFLFPLSFVNLSVCWAKKRNPIRTKSVNTLTLFLIHQNYIKINTCLSHPDRGILLWQPQNTKKILLNNSISGSALSIYPNISHIPLLQSPYLASYSPFY